MSTTAKAPGERKFKFSSINFRLIAFLAIVAIPLLFPVYVFVNQTLTGGIQRADGFSKVDLKSLGFFEFEQTTGTIKDVPKKWRDLDGQKVQLTGYMFSNLAASRVRDFELVYSVTKCCFNGPPMVQERVFVHIPADRPAMPYNMAAFMQMTGTLHVKVVKNEDGVIQSVYTLDLEAAQQLG
jgi:hypothetical protein